MVFPLAFGLRSVTSSATVAGNNLGVFQDLPTAGLAVCSTRLIEGAVRPGERAADEVLEGVTKR
jgi:hypothetical protein